MTSASTITPTLQPTPSKPFTVAIIGGGIGGLCLAVGLLRQHVPFHVYEAAHQFSEIGAGVALSPNSVRAMSLIDPAIRAGFDTIVTSNGSPEMQNTWFEFRMGMDGKGRTQGLKAGQKFAELRGKSAGTRSVHRAHFLDELVKLVPKDHASFGKRAMRVEDRDTEGVQIFFQDGTNAEASAVVGCDGVKSHVREYILGAGVQSPTFTGKYACRGIFDMDKASELLGDEVARNSQMHCGYHGHVLTFPIERGKMMNVVAFNSKSRWKDERWVLPMKKSDMEEDFADWGESVKKILSLMEKPDLWALFDHPPAATYCKGKVCIMGDAAHASTPHQGAGAGMAIEDALVLSSVLGLVGKQDELEGAFCAYDSVRRSRSQKLVTTSREAGEQWDFEADGVEDDLEKFNQRLQSRMGWIWDEDLDRELVQASKVFEATKI